MSDNLRLRGWTAMDAGGQFAQLRRDAGAGQHTMIVP
jgi:hypothetical protein